MRGRTAQPTALHQLEGTLRPTRHKRDQEPQPQGDLRQAPGWLIPAQRESWDYAIRHAPRGLLKLIDGDLLAAWVVAEDQLRRAVQAQAELDHRSAGLPLLLRGPSGLEISPYVYLVEKATKALVHFPIAWASRRRRGRASRSSPRRWPHPRLAVTAGAS